MKALLVARKSLLEMAREAQLLGLVLALPLVFLVITAVTYTGSYWITHPVWVQDAGGQGEALVAELEAQRYADGRPVFEITRVDDRTAADASLQEQAITALLVIDNPVGVPPGADGGVTIVGDALNPRFYRASVVLDGAISRHADRLAGVPEVVRLVEEPLLAGAVSEFDLYAPGMIVFALLMIIPQTAMLVARERRWDTLRRLRLTRLGAGSLLGGISLAQMAVAAVQVVLVFAAALAMGFHNRGSLAMALVIGLAISFSSVGLGLVVAGFVENDSQAANVGSTFAMLQVFLCGAFFQLPPMTLFRLAGHQIDLFDVFPASHGFLALQQVLTYGAAPGEVLFRLGATLLLSALYFVAGIAVFRRWQMRE
ncbi:MAG: ABC transporter permease [Anaerolineae bacterium]|jgi:ABC-2 type transport system permease protein